MADTGNLNFSFKGGYRVEATTVARAIDSLTEISSIIAKDQYPDVEFQLCVRAISPGSLNFVFESIATITPNIINMETVEYAKSLLETITACFTIKKFLKGAPAKDISKQENKIRIKNNDGNEIEISSKAGIYFTNCNIDNSMCNLFEGAISSKDVSGISISNDELSEKITIDRAEFEACALPVGIKSGKCRTKCVTRKNETLYIRKPDLSGDTQWEFVSDKNIKADIKDKEFLKTMQSGTQALYAKSFIVADVELELELDDTGLPNEKHVIYSIIKVHSLHTPDENQISF